MAKRLSQRITTSRGLAAITLAIIISVAISILVGTSMALFTTQNTQAKTANTLFEGKSAGWAGVEAFRRYLDSRTPAQIESLQDSQTIEITIDGVNHTLQATNLSVQTTDIPSSTDYLVKATLVSIDPLTQAQVKIAVNYLVDKPVAPASAATVSSASYVPPAQVVIKGDLNLAGQQTLTSAAGSIGEVLVDGNITVSSVTTIGFDRLAATGDIAVNSNAFFDVVQANGNVDLTHGASASRVYSRANVSLMDNANVDHVVAHGDVLLRARSTETVSTRGNINAGSPSDASGTRATHAQLIAHQNIHIHDQVSGVTNAFSRGNISLGDDELQTVDTIFALGQIDCTAAPWLSVNGDLVASSFSSCNAIDTQIVDTTEYESTTCAATCTTSTASAASSNGSSGSMGCDPTASSTYTVSTNPTTTSAPFVIPPGASVTSYGASSTASSGGSGTASCRPELKNPIEVGIVTSVTPTFDANLLRDSANFLIEPAISGSSLTQVKVTVQNMNGITDGEYFIGKSGTQENALCDSVDSAGTCLGNHAGFFCHGPGNIPLNKCFTYDSNTQELVLTAKFTLPGIVFVDGNLRVERPDGQDIPLRNSFLVTGNFRTDNVGSVSAVNYSTFTDVCELTFAQHAESPFSGEYPTNLCDFTNNSIIYTTEGNIAIGAGIYDTTVGAYTGGNVSFTSRSNIYGTIISGGSLFVSQQSFLHGTVLALNQTNAAQEHVFTDQASFTFGEGPQTYDAFDVPLTFDVTSNGGSGADSNYANDGVHEPARVMWSKYQ